MIYKEFYNYLIYEDGRVYSKISNKFLKPDIVRGYKQYNLNINKKQKKFKAHRLVAILFLDKPIDKDKKIVNHKDGNKLNCHYSNLEWCTYKYNNYHARINNLNNISKSNSERWKNENFREKTSKNISKGLIESKCFAGKNNPRYRYEIYDKKGKTYNRKSLMQYLNLSQSYTDTLIRKAANGKSNKYFEEKGILIKDIKK